MTLFGGNEYKAAKRRVNDRNTLSKINKLKSEAKDRKKSNDLKEELKELRLSKFGLTKDRRAKLKKGLNKEINSFMKKPKKRKLGKGLGRLL